MSQGPSDLSVFANYLHLVIPDLRGNVRDDGKRINQKLLRKFARKRAPTVVLAANEISDYRLPLKIHHD